MLVNTFLSEFCSMFLISHNLEANNYILSRHNLLPTQNLEANRLSILFRAKTCDVC